MSFDEWGRIEHLMTAGDTVIEQTRTWYDADGNTIASARYQRLENDTTSTGELTAVNSYATGSVAWYGDR